MNLHITLKLLAYALFILPHRKLQLIPLDQPWGIYLTHDLIIYHADLNAKQMNFSFFCLQLCHTLVVSLILMAGPVFYAQIFWPREEGYMTKTRKSTIKWHCVRSLFKQGCVAALIFTMLKLAHLTPESWGWERLLAIGAGQLLGYTLLLPVFLISTR